MSSREVCSRSVSLLSTGGKSWVAMSGLTRDKQSMISTNTLRNFLLIVGGAIVIFIFALMSYRDYTESVAVYRDFKVIGFDDRIDGQFQIFSLYKGYIFLVVNRTEKIAIGPTRGLNCMPRLREFISSSYTIHKAQFSDTIVFKRRGVECKFLLLE